MPRLLAANLSNRIAVWREPVFAKIIAVMTGFDKSGFQFAEKFSGVAIFDFVMNVFLNTAEHPFDSLASAPLQKLQKRTVKINLGTRVARC